MVPTLPHPVRALVNAANAGDTEAFLACFTPDGVVDDWGREFRGGPAIEGWSSKEFIGVRVSLRVTAVEDNDTVVSVAAQVGGDGFNGPSHFVFDLAGHHVSRMTIRG